APEDTSTTWLPSFTRAASTPASAAIRPSSIRPSVVSEDEPTLTTTRRAVAMSPRSSAGVPRCPRWPPVPAAGRPPRPPTPPPAPPPQGALPPAPPRVPGPLAPLRGGPARPNPGGRPGRHSGAPAHHARAVAAPVPPPAPGWPPRLGKCLLHADAGQPVTEV